MHTHLHLLLRVAVGLEHIDMRDKIERQWVSEELVVSNSPLRPTDDLQATEQIASEHIA